MSRDDAEFLETVARALGERVSLIRQRGFSLIGPDGERTFDGHDASDDESDLIDLAASGWLDWDARDDARPYRRHTAGRRRKRLKIALSSRDMSRWRDARRNTAQPRHRRFIPSTERPHGTQQETKR